MIRPRLVDDPSNHPRYSTKAILCLGSEATGKKGRVLLNVLIFKTVPHGQDRWIALDFFGEKPIGFSGRPRFTEESGTQNNDAESGLCESGVDLCA